MLYLSSDLGEPESAAVFETEVDGNSKNSSTSGGNSDIVDEILVVVEEDTPPGNTSSRKAGVVPKMAFLHVV